MIRRRDAGESVTQVTTALGHTIYVIRATFRRHNVQWNPTVAAKRAKAPTPTDKLDDMLSGMEELYDQGWSLAYAAQRLKLSAADIQATFRRHGKEWTESSVPTRLAQATPDIRRRRFAGDSTQKIADAYKVTHKQVIAACNKQGIVVKKQWTDEERQEMRHLAIDKRLTTAEIGSAIRRSTQAVYEQLAKDKISLFDRPKQPKCVRYTVERSPCDGTEPCETCTRKDYSACTWRSASGCMKTVHVRRFTSTFINTFDENDNRC